MTNTDPFPIAPDPNKLVILQVVLSEEDYLGWIEI